MDTEAAIDPVEKQAYSVKDAANACGISRTLIYKQMKLGVLRTVKIGRRRLIPRDALKALVDGRRS